MVKIVHFQLLSASVSLPVKIILVIQLISSLYKMRNTISVCYPLLCLLAVILLRRMLLFCTRSELIILLPECSVQSFEEAWRKILMKPCALWTRKDSRPTKENYTKYHTRKETCQVQSSIKELFSGSYMTIAS